MEAQAAVRGAFGAALALIRQAEGLGRSDSAECVRLYEAATAQLRAAEPLAAGEPRTADALRMKRHSIEVRPYTQLPRHGAPVV